LIRTVASLRFMPQYLASLKLVSRHDLGTDAPIPHELRPLWLRSSPQFPSSGFYLNILCLFLVYPLKATYLFFLFNYKDKSVSEHRWCVKKGVGIDIWRYRKERNDFCFKNVRCFPNSPALCWFRQFSASKFACV
jgi:hypothetical protein